MLEVRNLAISFTRRSGLFGRQELAAVSDISLSVERGEVVALVGESGAGKSLLAHALLGLLPANATIDGAVVYKGEKISLCQMAKLRGREIALIPQSVKYLNPLLGIGRQVYRSARLSGRCKDTAAQSRDRAFARYHLADPVKAMLPFQISGGMARRVLTATATSGKADLILADEPTTGLDQRMVRKSLGHLRELADRGKGVLLISHDLKNAVAVADTLVVLYRGQTLEITPPGELYQEKALLHPYTRALWEALPQNGFASMPADPAEKTASPHGCIFANRCSLKERRCHGETPGLYRIDNKELRCHHARS